MNEKDFKDIQLELVKQYRDGNMKFIYYQIALCIAAIAFLVNLSIALPLNLKLIPLGLGIVLWTSSIVYGFLGITTDLDMIRTNHLFYEVMQGRMGTQQIGKVDIEEGSKILKEELHKISAKQPPLAAKQRWTMYLGMISFLCWVVIKMYSNSL